MQCNRSKSDERYVAVLKTEDKQAEKQQQQIKSKSHLKRHWENYFVMAVCLGMFALCTSIMLKPSSAIDARWQESAPLLAQLSTAFGSVLAAVAAIVRTSNTKKPTAFFALTTMFAAVLFMLVVVLATVDIAVFEGSRLSRACCLTFFYVGMSLAALAMLAAPAATSDRERSRSFSRNRPLALCFMRSSPTPPAASVFYVVETLLERTPRVSWLMLGIAAPLGRCVFT